MPKTNAYSSLDLARWKLRIMDPRDTMEAHLPFSAPFPLISNSSTSAECYDI